MSVVVIAGTVCEICRSARLCASICAKSGDRRAQVGFGGVPEFVDQRVALERLLHDAALNAFAPAVNQPHLAQPGLVGGVHVFLDDGLDVARRERVKIERVLDRNAMRFVNSQLPTPDFQAVQRQPVARLGTFGVGRRDVRRKTP